MDKQKKKALIISLAMICTSIALSVYLFIVLPDVVVVQITSSLKDADTMGKTLALGAPLAITCGSTLAYYFLNRKIKYLVFAACGILLTLITWYMNT